MSACLALVAFLQGTVEVPSGDAFAESIAAGSDLNGDGIPDLVIADDTLHDGVDLWFVSGSDGSVFARRTAADAQVVFPVERVGDVDGDGVPEFAAWMRGERGPGRVELLSGRDASVLGKIEGKETDDGIFPGCIRVADVHVDGIRDLVLCGDRKTSSGISTLSILQLSGKDCSQISRIDRTPDDESWIFSAPIAVGDIDGDGREDFGVLATDIWGGANVLLASGRDGSTLHSLTYVERLLVSSMDGGADFDADGRPDVLVGIRGTGSSADGGGRVCVYSGADGALPRTVLGRDVVGPSSAKGFGSTSWDLVESFGETVRIVPDVDGDGTPDLLVGAPEFIGAAYLCSGRNGARLQAFAGQVGPFDSDGRDRGQCHVGRAMSAAGDVDGDGVGDVAIASVPKSGRGFGCVRVFSGKTGKLLRSIDRDSLVRARSSASIPR